MISKTSFAPATVTTIAEIKERVRNAHIPTSTVVFGGGDGGEETLLLPDFHEQVHRGMILLDSITPGWEYVIDSARLNLEDKTSCMLGQLYEKNSEQIPGYSYVVKTYMTEHSLDASDYGFDFTDDQRRWIDVAADFDNKELPALTSRAWEHLTATWVDAINGRLRQKLLGVASSHV